MCDHQLNFALQIVPIHLGNTSETCFKNIPDLSATLMLLQNKGPICCEISCEKITPPSLLKDYNPTLVDHDLMAIPLYLNFSYKNMKF